MKYIHLIAGVILIVSGLISTAASREYTQADKELIDEMQRDFDSLIAESDDQEFLSDITQYFIGRSDYERAFDVAGKINDNEKRNYFYFKIGNGVGSFKGYENIDLALDWLLEEAANTNSSNDKNEYLATVFHLVNKISDKKRVSILLDKALEIIKSIENPYYQATAMCNLAEVRIKMRDQDAGYFLLVDAIKKVNSLENPINPEVKESDSLDRKRENYYNTGILLIRIQRTASLLKSESRIITILNAITNASRKDDIYFTGMSRKNLFHELTYYVLNNLKRFYSDSLLINLALGAVQNVRPLFKEEYDALGEIMNVLEERRGKKCIDSLLTNALSEAVNIRDSHRQTNTLISVTEFVNVLDDKDRVNMLIDSVIDRTHQIDSAYLKTNVLLSVLKILEKADDLSRIGLVLDYASSVSDSILNPRVRAYYFTILAETPFRIGREEQALNLLINGLSATLEIENESYLSQSYGGIIGLSRSFKNKAFKDSIWIMTKAAINGSNSDQAKMYLMDELKRDVKGIGKPELQDSLINIMVQIAGEIKDPDTQNSALKSLWVTFLRTEDIEGYYSILNLILNNVQKMDDPRKMGETLTFAAQVASKFEIQKREYYLNWIYELNGSITQPEYRVQVLVDISEALIKAGFYKQGLNYLKKTIDEIQRINSLVSENEDDNFAEDEGHIKKQISRFVKNLMHLWRVSDNDSLFISNVADAKIKLSSEQYKHLLWSFIMDYYPHKERMKNSELFTSFLIGEVENFKDPKCKAELLLNLGFVVDKIDVWDDAREYFKRSWSEIKLIENETDRNEQISQYIDRVGAMGYVDLVYDVIYSIESEQDRLKALFVALKRFWN